MHLIVEFDGGSRGNPGPAGFGVVVRAADDGTPLVTAGRFIGHATMPLLVQSGRFDVLVPMGDAQVLHAVVPDPKTILWYDAGHGLNQQAVFDRHNWLVQHVGLDPLQAGNQ